MTLRSWSMEFKAICTMRAVLRRPRARERPELASASRPPTGRPVLDRAVQDEIVLQHGDIPLLHDDQRRGARLAGGELIGWCQHRTRFRARGDQATFSSARPLLLEFLAMDGAPVVGRTHRELSLALVRARRTVE